jgi:hypothetical protein
MRKSLLTLLIPLTVACSPYTKEHTSHIDLPISEVATEMAHDVRARNFGDAVHRPAEHSWSLGYTSQAQKEKYKSAASHDNTAFLEQAKSCYHDLDLAHCAPRLGKYFTKFDER